MIKGDLFNTIKHEGYVIRHDNLGREDTGTLLFERGLRGSSGQLQ
jgi:hypothetical protein